MNEIFKVVIVGDIGVGKSSILERYVSNSFRHDIDETICIDFYCHSTRINNKIVKQQIWDTSGQPRFRAITTSYYRGAHAVILVFDLQQRQSFENLKAYLSNIDINGNDDVILICCGNKADTKNQQVYPSDINAFCSKYQIPYFETSAKTGLGVNESFQYVLKEHISRSENLFDEHQPILKKEKEHCRCTIL